MIFKWGLLILLVTILSTSCIRKDITDYLYPCIFSFHYDNPDDSDLVTFSSIRLFLYDDQGLLIKEILTSSNELTENGNELKIDLPIGNYGIVSWGENGESYNYTGIDNFETSGLSLSRDEDGVVTDTPDHLYHSIRNDIKITGIIDDDIYSLEYNKISNNLNISIEVVDRTRFANTSALSNIKCYITAENGDYTFSNEVMNSDRVIYFPQGKSINNKLYARFVVLELWEEDNSRLIIVKQQGTEEVVVYDGSISDIILKHPETNLNEGANYNMDFRVEEDNSTGEGNLNITITINGWEIINQSGDL